MIIHHGSIVSSRRERGMVLVTALLLLVVVTILAVGMFRSFGLDEKIAGNVREKNRAMNAAVTTENYAEYWLTQSSNATTGISCAAGAPVIAPAGQVCTAVTGLFNPFSNGLGSATSLPWPTQVTYTPSAPSAANATPTPMNITGGAGGAGNYYLAPAYYITYLGEGSDKQGVVYQIDAVGYGGSADTAAVVESTYEVGSTSSYKGGQ
jgi:type IV pilus assembly protein PilX